MNMYKVLSISMSAILTSTIALAANSPTAKHLAGPAEEIELMQKVNPEELAIISKSAMIPVDLVPNKGHYEWQKKISIDGENPRALLFTPDGDQQHWQININGHNSSKDLIKNNQLFTEKDLAFGMGAVQLPATEFSLRETHSSSYEFQISSARATATEAYLLVSSDSPYRLKSFVSSHGQLVGDVISIKANAFTDDSEFTVVRQDLSLIKRAYLKITSPDGSTFRVKMLDDGLGSDEVARDGEFYAEFIAEHEGLYQVQVVSKGITPRAKPFYRTAEHTIPIVYSDLELGSDYAEGSYTNGHKINLDFALTTAKDDRRFRVMAEVWGTQANSKAGKLIPVSWISTIADARNGKINLQLDDRWLLAKGVQAPFELKNIRIEDTTHYVSLLNIERLELTLPMVQKISKLLYDASKLSYRDVITESMLKGEKPEQASYLNKSSADKLQSQGAKLMLVHGYCSSDVWGPVQSQFSNSVKFVDFNQNRSHDAFARLIDTFGDNYSSFGIVAHSQGGAAALHLYTYYWSGLDDAGFGRLIQSVGTPYLGTPLAGNLAAIGNIFGVGCGYNSNLTTSGASSWLSGIPTWARSKVSYYTTSFKDRRWRYDYCSLASDWFLSDPEDGVVERSRGQLSGASNRGHRTGQCHTDDMRDMSQLHDSGRNSIMNSNAAR
ncbi:MAG: hypothetical protein L3J24_13860 [Xanthomonadales bacterium]|nr:hypothetical protein [Xanthomonadales bacterium]